jgi:hypothetical protein
MAMLKSNAIILAEGDATAALSGIESARVAADAMLRVALECCHQHDRYARLVARPALEAEHRAADETCSVVARALAQMAQTYGEAAQDLRPNGGPDEDWWHCANALWHASREFARRQTCGERPARGPGTHDADALADLVVQYDLEASALLALRQAADAYRKLRPEAW